MGEGVKSCLLILLISWLSIACKEGAVFKQLSASRTGIDFSNEIKEDDRYNVYNFMNIYTGAGVSAGDINNDGLTDLYFSGNMVSGRLYLNQGNLNFLDITETSGIENTRWGTGTVMTDINQDGWTDIYITVSGSDDIGERANMLYINNGDNTFSESAAKFGIADTRQAMHSAFFDYDRDGDLDLFIIVNPAAYENSVNTAQPRKLNGESPSTDVLYRNNGDNTFTDVSREAGILVEGYSLGLAISDINKDQWPDIYISNDFIGNDVLYMNNGDGTFSDRISDHIKHTSYAGMGNDISDINNDGLVDIMVLDMRPNDNKRQKLIISSTGYDRFQLMLNTGYDPQYTRNTLQLNRGGGLFSEIGFMSGVSSTDWSWSSLLADYDNDGDRDLFVTNGFLRDLGNLDYIHYSTIYNNSMGDRKIKIENKLDAISSLEGADLVDFVFENKGNAMFEDRTKEWGIYEKGFSNGALYADLDNDGDLEIVVNTINGAAHVYENKSSGQPGKNFLKVRLEGKSGNKEGLGSKISVRADDQVQYYEHFTSRGYESSIDPLVHFGMGKAEDIDEIEIIWPDGSFQVIKHIASNQLIILKQFEAEIGPFKKSAIQKETLLKDISRTSGLNFQHKEDDYVDFKNQPVIPHMHSKGGPGIAVADVNSDGLEDFYIGGATGQSGRLYIQQTNSEFESVVITIDSAAEEMGLLFFDADNDSDQDLYIGNGGTSFLKDAPQYKDKLLVNDGNGNFSLSEGGLPQILTSTSCVVASDYDKDGDLDLFVGGRVVPGAYPMPPNSYLLRNDSQSGKPKFTDITPKELSKIGMVTSALWTDYDNDGWQDLMLVGEFMPITFFKNAKGNLVQPTPSPIITPTHGWWNSLVGGDFDMDGDIDYLAGNLGLNSRFQATPDEPLCIYASDYNKDGKIDPLMCYYIEGENYIAHTRDDIIKQVNAMRVRFKTYESYANATFEESFLPEELEQAYLVQSVRFQSSYIENLGEGRFAIEDLPWETQVAPIFGMVADDFDGDGYLDVLAVGNSYATEVSTGRYDASVGTFLKGNGQGQFYPTNLEESGFSVDTDAKGLVRLYLENNMQLILVGNNSDNLAVYAVNAGRDSFKPSPTDAYALITNKNGSVYKQEFYYGSTYLSQSSRRINLNSDFKKMEVVDFQGKNREVMINSLIIQ